MRRVFHALPLAPELTMTIVRSLRRGYPMLDIEALRNMSNTQVESLVGVTFTKRRQLATSY